MKTRDGFGERSPLGHRQAVGAAYKAVQYYLALAGFADPVAAESHGPEALASLILDLAEEWGDEWAEGLALALALAPGRGLDLGPARFGPVATAPDPLARFLG